MHYIYGFLAGAALFIGGLFGHSTPAPSFGVALPTGTALFETSLQSRISPTDTSMTLVANSVKGGESISGYNCFTIDEGRSDSEYVCGQVSGTAVTALERGLSLTTGTSSIVALQFQHRAGADVKITDFPLIQRLRNQANGNESYPNILNYTFSPDYSAASTTALVSYGLLQQTSFSGTVNSNESTKGISELATAAEAASGASTGSTGARLVLPASLSTSTCQTAVNAVLVASSTTGKLDANCIPTNGDLTFTGANTFASTATTTLAGTTTIAANSSNKLTLNTVPYVAPSTQGTVGTFLKNDGSGNLSWNASLPRYSLSVTSGPTAGVTAGTFATSSVLTIPAGTLSASSTITFLGNTECDANSGSTPTCTYYIRDISGTTLASCSPGVLGAASYKGTWTGTIANQSSLSSQTAISNCVVFNNASNTDPFFVASTNTSTFNTANALNLVVVALINTGANGQSNVNSFSLIVNP